MKETSVSPRKMYIRSTADITPNWNDMRNITDMNKLCEIMGEIYNMGIGH